MEAPPADAASIPMTVGQGACFLGFAVTGVLWAYSEILNNQRKKGKLDPVGPADEETAAKGGEGMEGAAVEKVSYIDNPFTRCMRLDKETLLDCRTLLRAMSEFALIMMWFYVADRTSAIPDAGKSYSRDLFMFLMLILFIVAFAASLHKIKTPALLNRDQTEEWKGYMQVVFLLYHYFEARELYNAIRLFIAAYVWMTGFGNFSYYYVRKDFSIGRFCQMMWRLNFLVFFCCMVLNNDYMLYYICPMHTIFTLLVYASLGVASKINQTTWGLTLKFISCVVIVVLLWDIKEVFYSVFTPLKWLVGYVDPRKGPQDALHEWYFRSGLDRYVWIYGMLCANMHPRSAAILDKIDSMEAKSRFAVRGAILAVCGGAGVAYYQNVYSLPKLQYNEMHPMTSFIPITIFIVLRNLTPAMRTYHLHIFGWLGKITLETYIAQFHVWLASDIPNGQPKFLMSLVPGYPLINFALCTALYILVSKRLFDLTVYFRDAFIPGKDGKKLLRNSVVMVAAWTALVVVAACAKVVYFPREA